MATNQRPVKSRRDIIDLIYAEADHQGYSVMNLAILAGYSKNYLTAAGVSGAISVQAAVDFLDTLGFDLAVVPHGSDVDNG